MIAFDAAADPIPTLLATQATASLFGNGGITMVNASGDTFSMSTIAGHMNAGPFVVDPGSTLTANDLTFELPAFMAGGVGTVAGTLYDLNIVPAFSIGEVIALESVIVPSQPTTITIPARITAEYNVFCRNAFPPGTPCPSTQIATIVIDLLGQESISFDTGPDSEIPIVLVDQTFVSTPVPEPWGVGLVVIGAAVAGTVVVRKRRERRIES